MRAAVGLLMLVSGLTGCGTKSTFTAHGQPVSYWVERIQDPDEKTRLRAVKALGNVGVKDPVVVPALITAVKDKQEEVRVEAILALLRMGPDARDAIPALTEARQDSSPKVRDCAVKALEKIQRP
jgi:vesicle coat complex subunit